MIALTSLRGCGANPPSPEPTEPVDIHATVDFSNAETCTSCHEATVAEWQQSMHVRAHASADPLYAAMLELRVKRQGEQIAARCAKCHNPMAPTEPDSPAGRAGVTCGACHSAEALVSPAASDGRTVCGQEGSTDDDLPHVGRAQLRGDPAGARRHSDDRRRPARDSGELDARAGRGGGLEPERQGGRGKVRGPGHQVPLRLAKAPK